MGMGRSSALLVLTLGALSCTDDGNTERCVAAAECAAGEVCLDGTCRRVCTDSNPCPTGWTCSGGVCLPGSSVPRAPAIHSLDGTGATDGQDGRTAHRLVDRVVVAGENLDGATAELTGPEPATTTVSLEACAPGTDTEMELGLPSDVVAGSYTLTAKNQLGAACTGLSLLKGEDGAQGTASVRSCPTSCYPQGFDPECPCYSLGTVSTSSTVICMGPSLWDAYTGTCGYDQVDTCDCPTVLGYLTSP